MVSFLIIVFCLVSFWAVGDELNLWKHIEWKHLKDILVFMYLLLCIGVCLNKDFRNNIGGFWPLIPFYIWLLYGFIKDIIEKFCNNKNE